MTPEEIAELGARAQRQILKVKQQFEKVEACTTRDLEYIDYLEDRIDILHREAKSSNRYFLLIALMSVFLFVMLIVK